MTITRQVLLLLGMMVAAIPALAQSPGATQTLANLRSRYPGARVLEHTGLVRIVCAAPMNSAPTPREAADEWLRQYASVFGAGSPELVLEFNRRISGNKRALVYRQYIGGFVVEGSRVNLVVNEQRESSVVYVCAKVARAPAGGFDPPAVTSAAALAVARTHPAARTMTNWQTPELLVVFADSTLRQIDGVLAWKCVGSGDPTGRSVAVYVDAQSGSVLRTVEMTLFSGPDITGTVTGNATPGTEPDIGGTGVCDNPAQDTLLPFLLVEALDSGGNVLDQIYTAANGGYSLTAPGAATVRASLIGPSWTVFDHALLGFAPPLSSGVGPTFPVIRDFQFNAAPTEEETAQVNAFLNVARTWDYFKTRILPVPINPLPGLDENITVVVNSNIFPCAAKYTATQPPAIVFGLASPGSCPNWAYSTIISHEYGHYLLDIMLGIGVADKAFHEGFADTLAHLVHDTELYGENYTGCCSVARDPLDIRVTCKSNVSGNRTYPDCDDAIHTQGMILSGIWLDLLKNMRVTHGSQGLELTRQLHVDWCFITAGERPAHNDCPTIPQVADAGTLIEVLTADDDDGNFSTGTPNCTEILAAFASHGIDLPIDSLVCDSDGAFTSSRACPPDLDTTTGKGVLDLFDYIAFQRLFIARDVTACDCDTSTGQGVCDIFDFLCFQNAFVAGCP